MPRLETSRSSSESEVVTSESVTCGAGWRRGSRWNRVNQDCGNGRNAETWHGLLCEESREGPERRAHDPVWRSTRSSHERPGLGRRAEHVSGGTQGMRVAPGPSETESGHACGSEGWKLAALLSASACRRRGPWPYFDVGSLLAQPPLAASRRAPRSECAARISLLGWLHSGACMIAMFAGPLVFVLCKGTQRHPRSTYRGRPRPTSLASAGWAKGLERLTKIRVEPVLQRDDALQTLFLLGALTPLVVSHELPCLFNLTSLRFLSGASASTGAARRRSCHATRRETAHAIYWKIQGFIRDQASLGLEALAGAKLRLQTISGSRAASEF